MKLILYLFIFIGFWSSNTITIDEHPNLLFYIERNMNKNTVIYEASFDKNGQLDKKSPIKAHWIMFEKNGESEELNYAEERMAYGIKCTIDKKVKDHFNVRLVADEKRLFTLEQTAPFKAQLTTVLNGEKAQLTRLFIEADNSSFWPKINYILLEGKNMLSNKTISERVNPEE